MSTIAMKQAIEMNHTNANEEAGVIERFKKYVLDSSDKFYRNLHEIFKGI